jgi:L-seryl-tRNA(Ser) seleniumtransferase
MAIPNWTIELLKRSLNEVADKARQPETIEKIKTQANEILQDLPQTAARGLDAVLKSADAGRKSVQQWTRKHIQLAVPMLNASGTLRTPIGSGVAMAESVVEVGREVGLGDCVIDAQWMQRIGRRLDRTIGGSDDVGVLLTSSFEAATASIGVLSATHTIAVHRSNCVQLDDGGNGVAMPLPSAISALGSDSPVGTATSGQQIKVLEVGSSNVASGADFAGLDRPCIVMADGGDQSIQPFDLSAISTGQDDLITVAILPVASLKPIGNAIDDLPSVIQWLDKVDLVVTPGDGLIGGPASGILAGRRDVLKRISESTVWPAVQANAATMAMMTVAMEIAASSDRSPATLLIETSEENLKSRADRLATRLRGHDQIAHCQVTADDARLTGRGRWRLPSRQVCLKHASKSAKAWAEDLIESLPAVQVHADEDCVKLDLRWIAAADDGKLAEVLTGEPPQQ